MPDEERRGQTSVRAVRRRWSLLSSPTPVRPGLLVRPDSRPLDPQNHIIQRFMKHIASLGVPMIRAACLCKTANSANNLVDHVSKSPYVSPVTRPNCRPK